MPRASFMKSFPVSSDTSLAWLALRFITVNMISLYVHPDSRHDVEFSGFYGNLEIMLRWIHRYSTLHCCKIGPRKDHYHYHKSTERDKQFTGADPNISPSYYKYCLRFLSCHIRHNLSSSRVHILCKPRPGHASNLQSQAFCKVSDLGLFHFKCEHLSYVVKLFVRTVF